MAGMLKQGDVPTTKPAEPAKAAPAAEPVAKAAENTAAAGPAENQRPVDSIENSARQIAESSPDMPVMDEITGQVSTASKLLEEADAAFKQDQVDARAFDAAVICFLGRGG